ncbi:MAG TPA: DNA-deoxyinosine glycosylase [Candidatus Omnitrophota bacterium]|mgnify:CR=1 FL=1|nr:DNA-deoxyinosine glycosylase [Candidatus Omnitrophota bacterium]HPS20759.1 DNA-deoxyinosine glycosylase [Candidatus Omnitrophota bacterium]
MNTKSPRIKGFPPIVNNRCRVLIVGTLPGPDSLIKYEYYGHSNNKFWPIMMDILGGDSAYPYKERTALLLKKRIALWDVYESGIRPGASDSAIKTPEMNDFVAFFRIYPKIERVYCNGNMAFQVFSRNFGQFVKQITVLPSTSPAFAKPYGWKKKKWENIYKTRRQK